MRNILSEILLPTQYLLLALHLVLFVIIIKVQVSCKYQHFIWAKAVNKKSVIYYKPMFLYLIPIFPKFLKFWCVDFGLSLIENSSTDNGCRIETKTKNWWHFESKVENYLFVSFSVFFYWILTSTALWYHLAEHWHFSLWL